MSALWCSSFICLDSCFREIWHLSLTMLCTSVDLRHIVNNTHYLLCPHLYIYYFIHILLFIYILFILLFWRYYLFVIKNMETHINSILPEESLIVAHIKFISRETLMLFNIHTIKVSQSLILGAIVADRCCSSFHDNCFQCPSAHIVMNILCFRKRKTFSKS